MTKRQSEKLCIGPLVLRSDTPLNIYTSLQKSLKHSVNSLNSKTVIQLNFINIKLYLGKGRFNQHINAINNCLQWLQKYDLQALYKLNCSVNLLPTIKYISIFYLPRLELLYLNDCKIESIELLTENFFPNLMVLALYNNYITSLKSIRKCWTPLLCQLIVDSNNISELSSLSQMLSTRLQRLQVHNNRIIDIRSLFKLNSPNLVQIRYQSELLIHSLQKQVVSMKLERKFPQLGTSQ